MASEDRNMDDITQAGCTDCTPRERSFDELTRGLADGSLSRRKALRLFGGALVGSVLASIPGVALAKPPAGACKPQGAKCNVPRDCCSQNCFNQSGKLICGPASGSGACFNDNDCASFPGQDLCTKAVCNQTTNACVLAPAKTCPSSSNPCVARTECDPTTGNCREIPGNAGTVCRPAQGDCDLPAVCTGESNQCPDNPFRPPTFVCQTAQGECEGPALCTGDSAQCPNNPLLTTDVMCREAAGDCDLPAFCTGESNQCPDNPFRPNTFVCQEANGPCQVAATCTGNSAQCPANGIKVDGTPCNNDNDLCTLEECRSGVCRPTGNTVNCSTTTTCKVSVCAPATGTCVEQNAPPNTPCTSTNRCITGATCNSNGTCQGGTTKACPTGQTCVPATGVCTCTTGVTCGDLCCTGTQICCPPGTRRAGQCRNPSAGCN